VLCTPPGAKSPRRPSATVTSRPASRSHRTTRVTVRSCRKTPPSAAMRARVGLVVRVVQSAHRTSTVATARTLSRKSARRFCRRSSCSTRRRYSRCPPRGTRSTPAASIAAATTSGDVSRARRTRRRLVGESSCFSGAIERARGTVGSTKPSRWFGRELGPLAPGRERTGNQRQAEPAPGRGRAALLFGYIALKSSLLGKTWPPTQRRLLHEPRHEQPHVSGQPEAERGRALAPRLGL